MGYKETKYFKKRQWLNPIKTDDGTTSFMFGEVSTEQWSTDKEVTVSGELIMGDCRGRITLYIGQGKRGLTKLRKIKKFVTEMEDAYVKAMDAAERVGEGNE